MPRAFYGPCGYIHTTLVDAACVHQPPNLRLSTRSKKPLNMVEGGMSVKAEKAVESSTETLQVPVDTKSGVSDDEQALLDKLKRWLIYNLSTYYINGAKSKETDFQ